MARRRLAHFFSTGPKSAQAVTLGLFHARAGRIAGMRHVCDKCGKEIDSVGPCTACTRKLAISPRALFWLILAIIVTAIAGAVIRSCLEKMGLSDMFTA